MYEQETGAEAVRAMGDLSETPSSLLRDDVNIPDDIWNTWHGDDNHSLHPFDTDAHTRISRTFSPGVFTAADLQSLNESNRPLQSTYNETGLPSASTPSVVTWNILSSDSESHVSPTSSQFQWQARTPTHPTHSMEQSQQTTSEFVDLTEDTSSPSRPRMPSPSSPPRSQKRRRLDADSSAISPRARQRLRRNSRNAAPPALEEVDLRDVEDEKGLSKVLEDQRMATIRAQQEEAARPVKLATLSCVICMEPMTDVTATYCGKPRSTHILSEKQSKRLI